MPGTHAFGTTFSWNSAVIAGLTAINGIELSVDTIDVTTHQSANYYKEILPGLIDPGEVSIVALGTIKPKPWVVNGEIRARMVTTVAASFDHRVVDGDVASKFVADVASVMEEPALLLD
jgi:hypothetical protein